MNIIYVTVVIKLDKEAQKEMIRLAAAQEFMMADY